MFCEQCGAQILNNSRFCGYCGHTVSYDSGSQPADALQVYCDTLDRRFTGLGFEVKRNVSAPPNNLGLVARKKGVDTFIEVFGRITAFIAVGSMDNPDPDAVARFSERVAGLAKASGSTSHLFMTMTFPVIVSESIESRVRDWLTESKMGPYYNMIVFPVIVVRNSGEVVFCKRTGFVGAVQYPKLRDFATYYLHW